MCEHTGARATLTLSRVIAVGLSLFILAGCADKSAPATPTSSTDIPIGSATVGKGDISALGIIRPAQTLQLSFGASGRVRTMLAQLGVPVAEGDLLAELDTAALELQLHSAQQEIIIRQAQLDRLVNGQQAALVERAEAEHARQVAQAEIALQMAQLQLEQTRLQGHAPAVAVAKANLQQLASGLARDQELTPLANVIIAELNLARAKDALATAQVEYQKALDRPWEPQEVRDAYAKAVQQAEWQVQSAQAQLDAARRNQTAHDFGLDALVAQRDAAEAQLVGALNAQAAYSLTLELLAAEVDLAQLQLDGLLAWENPHLDPAPPEEITQATAHLQQAELAAAQLELQLQGAELRAPFTGVISAIYLHPGEWATPGTPAVAILDTTRWYVETRNVSELTIGQIQIGQEAIVHVNALGQEIRGQVMAISPISVVQQGDTTYTLTIELESTDLNLRPGMTVQVKISTG